MMRRKKILIVDDEKQFGEMIKINLETDGDYEVCVETRGRLALATARRFNPDLILLDIIMPDKSGYDVARDFSLDAGLRAKPFIYLTALSKPEVFLRESEREHIAYLAKPVSRECLLEAIRTQMGVKPGGG